MRVQGRARAGFTLIEAMIVLMIIGVMAAAIAPSLMEVLADNRQVTATQDLVRLGRRARSLALGSGYAYLLRFQEDLNRGLGKFHLWAGMNNRCTQTDWVGQVLTIDDPASTCGPPSPTSPIPAPCPVEVLGMRDYNPTDGVTAPSSTDTERQVITARSTSPLVWLCFQPNGEVYGMTGGTWGIPPPFTKQAQPFVFTISRYVNASGGTVTRGRDRQVVFPVGGSARAR